MGAFSSTGNVNNAQEHQDTEIISLSGSFVNEWKPAAPAQWVRLSLLLAQAGHFQCALRPVVQASCSKPTSLCHPSP